ncbi:MAG: metal-dependent transcriptional regulator [Bacteroidetes bacterium]|jgi:DtxR family transcriptional regulator, Mn-dependent transcriptional regulator|nr:metal-dependent transcriptional regulator [Bacteroidota bacterium]
MPTQTKENYLKAAYFLHHKGEGISLTQLSQEMKVSKPTVNDMVKKMEANGWVTYEKYKPLTLTAKGKKLAALIVRKHRLAEMFLSQIMGFGWEEVHDIAEEMEHVQSDKFFDRMNELLGFPTVDPHGSPIPDKHGRTPVQNYRPLTEAKQGERLRLVALADSSKELLVFLNRKNIRLGTELRVEQIESFDQSITVKYGKEPSTMLSAEVGKCLLVEGV